MNTQQQNRLAMYLAVKAVCDANFSVWQTSPAFADGYSDFITHLNSVQTLAQGRRLAASGGAPDKLQAQQIMCQAAVTVASAIRAYAIKTRNDIVAGAANLSISDLMRARDLDCARRCQNIHDLADTSLTYLAAYGMTAAKLGMLQSAIADFNAITEKPRPAIAAGKTTTSRLSDEFDAADKVLNQELDNLIEQFQFINAKFVMDYQQARAMAGVAASQRQPDDDARPGHATASA
jgi:hypothetical protein